MFEIRLTSPDGSARTESFRGNQLAIGRDASNHVPVTGNAVSSRHCTIELSNTGAVVHDQGSRNGTYVNNQRISAPTPIREGDRVFVGSYLIELVRANASVVQRQSSQVLEAASGPILRTPGPNRDYRDLHGRYLRYADEWDRKGRPAQLALKSEELSRALKWLASAQPGMFPEITRLQREFIAASKSVVKKKSLVRVLGIVGGVVALAGIVTIVIVAWPTSDPEVNAAADTDSQVNATDGDENEDSEGDDSGGGFDALGNVDDPTDERGVDSAGSDDVDENEEGVVDKEIKHTVIPYESMPDIATRYGVSIDDLAAWNFLNPDEPDLEEGTKVVVQSPKQRPLPQQKVEHELEKGEGSWTKLAKRFDVPVTKLEKYNPKAKLDAGAKIVVWVDPKPYQPVLPRKPIPLFTVDKRAASIGKPAAGALENGIQLPASPLYTRANPRLQWGSSQTISNLQTAVATFRQDVAYDGALILSDISKKGGGQLPPHKSHQAGRDIDIWLPTLKGVYKTKHVGKGKGKIKPRRPRYDEVDWYATWGLVRALIKTGAVQYVFLDWIYQETVYRAAVNMGATEEELDEWIQWPRPRASSKGIFRHSKDHLSHIHVRFKCAPWEPDCKGAVAKP